MVSHIIHYIIIDTFISYDAITSHYYYTLYYTYYYWHYIYCHYYTLLLLLALHSILFTIIATLLLHYAIRLLRWYWHAIIIMSLIIIAISPQLLIFAATYLFACYDY